MTNTAAQFTTKTRALFAISSCSNEQPHVLDLPRVSVVLGVQWPEVQTASASEKRLIFLWCVP